MSKNRRALVVGINYYNHISSLYGCVDDAILVSSVLERHWDGRKNFDVRLITGADRKRSVSNTELRKAIKELFSKDLELVLFYFAGRGYIGPTGGYLLASDSESWDGEDGVALLDVFKYAEESGSRNKIIVLDCCHATASWTNSGKSELSELSELSEGLIILEASTAEQYSIEEFGGGVFTNLFVDALKGAARNLIGDVTMASLYAHIDQSLGTWDQRPSFKAYVSSFVSLRQVEPPIEFGDLTRIVELFPVFDEQNREYYHHLDPSYEPDSEHPDPQKNAIFKILHRYNQVNLVVPVGADHMYFAAMESKPCKLTVLGKHYRRVIANNFSNDNNVLEVSNYLNWELNIEGPLHSAIGVPLKIRLILTKASQVFPEGKRPSSLLTVPNNSLEVAAYIEAPGFHLETKHVQSLKTQKGQMVDRELEFDLVPLSRGAQTIGVQVYPSPHEKTTRPARCYLTVEVDAPEIARLELPAIIDRQKDIYPQPHVVLYVYLDTTKGSEQHLRYCITCPSLDLDREFLDPPIALDEKQIYELRNIVYEGIAQQSQYSSDDSMATLQAIGALLFDQLIPNEHPLLEIYWKLRRLSFNSINRLSWLIVSEERAILPWELIMPYGIIQRTGKKSTENFFAQTFVISYWIGSRGYSLANELPIGAISLTHYNQKSKEKIDRWALQLGGEKIVRIHTNDGLEAIKKQGSAYFGFHLLRFPDITSGQIAPKVDFVPPGSDSSGDAFIDEYRYNFTLKRPVIGLSLLSGSSSYSDYRSITSLESDWIIPFMQAGASAVVGPRWLVKQEIDQLFYRVFYDNLRSGIRLGKAAWLARETIRKTFPNDPGWLAYACFGHPMGDPYIVEPTEGYTFFEAINHPVNKPFEAGNSYDFRASYRTEAPLWYNGKLKSRSYSSLDNMQLSVHVILISEQTETISRSLSQIPEGTDYEASISIMIPETRTTLPVIVRFEKDQKEINTLMLNLDISGVEGDV